MESNLKPLQDLIGQNIVIDTNSPYIYLGKLVEIDKWFITLENVDVHDQKEGHATKEKYIMEARKSGINKNRKSVVIRQDQIISFSKLNDVILY